jgi:hypothetical protein
LEDSLKNALVSRFRSTAGHNVDMNERLFRVGGPLGFLVPKIQLGYQLYVFEKPYRNAMFGIAEIRNMFAHQLDLTFLSEAPSLKEALNKLTLHEGRTYYPNPFTEEDHTETPIVEPTDTPRDKFIVNLKLCLLWLMGDSHRHPLYINAHFANYRPR